jgi:hypothetical protein
MSRSDQRTAKGIAQGHAELNKKRQQRINSQTVKYEPKQNSGKTLSRMSDEDYYKWHGGK